MLEGRIRESRLFKRIRALTQRYERFWIPAMLVGGLASDVVQYSALDIREKFFILAVYAVVALGSFLVISYEEAGKVRGLRALALASPFLHQFSVGGLLAASLLFYSFSGALSVSWPIIILIAVCMMANEFLRSHFLRPSAQVAVFTFSFISLLSIFFSYMFHSLRPVVFIAGGLVSIVLMAAYMVLLIRVGKLYASRKAMWLSVLFVFSAMNIGYFLNVLPPIPLSLRDAGIYTTIERKNGDYIFTSQPESWLRRIVPGQTLHITSDETLFAYSAIFAPTALSTNIVHKWQRYDDTKRSWITESTLSFPIVGGRDSGYRGYSKKSHLTAGKWRVSVETPREQVVGRIHFRVVIE